MDKEFKKFIIHRGCLGYQVACGYRSLAIVLIPSAAQ